MMANNHHGLFGWLWSLFGSTTPTYLGTGQPVQSRGWCGWLSTTPAYEVAPVEDPKAKDVVASETEPEVDASESVKDSGNGHEKTASFAIVIQRE